MVALARIEQGRRPEAEATCREILEEAVDRSGRTLPAAAPLRVALGLAAYEANDLGTAACELEAGFGLCRRLGMDALLTAQSRWALAMTRLVVEGATSAREAVADGLRAAGQLAPAVLLPEAEAIGALVSVRTHDGSAALRWAERVVADPDRAELSTPLVRLYRDLTIVRVMLAKGRTASAAAVVTDAGRSARRTGSVLGQIEASILGSCCAEQAGHRADAIRRLAAAVELAAPGRYVRRFVDDGLPVAHLLSAVHGESPAFVDEVSEAIARETSALAQGRARAGRAWQPSEGAVLELLTPRELDVLRLLATGRSNAAIGERLGMSPGTAKWHVANVLGKLGASTRTEAAGRARDLGLV